MRAAHEICEIIAGFYSDVERSVYISKAAERLSIEEKSIRTDTERIRKKKIREEDGERMRKIISDTSGYTDNINRERVGNTRAAKAEETIIGLILLYPELFSKAVSEEWALCPEDFKTSFGRRVFEALEKLGGKADIGVLAADFSVDEISRITDMQRKRAELTKNDESVLFDSIKALREEKNETSGDELADAMKILQAKKHAK